MNWLNRYRRRRRFKRAVARRLELFGARLTDDGGYLLRLDGPEVAELQRCLRGETTPILRHPDAEPDDTEDGAA